MYATWFVFAEDDTKYISNLIKELSSKYHSQIFKPHITAYGLVDISLEKLDKIVSDSVQGQKQISLKKSKLDYSDVFWKTLFVEFLPNESLTRINDELTKSLESLSKYEFIPHASLIYQKMNSEEQKRLANTLDIQENFKITGMCIQEFSEDITKWKIVRNYEFEC
jgi:2'-5' RNA ligase